MKQLTRGQQNAGTPRETGRGTARTTAVRTGETANDPPETTQLRFYSTLQNGRTVLLRPITESCGECETWDDAIQAAERQHGNGWTAILHHGLKRTRDELQSLPFFAPSFTTRPGREE